MDGVVYEVGSTRVVDMPSIGGPPGAPPSQDLQGQSQSPPLEAAVT